MYPSRTWSSLFRGSPAAARQPLSCDNRLRARCPLSLLRLLPIGVANGLTKNWQSLPRKKTIQKGHLGRNYGVSIRIIRIFHCVSHDGYLNGYFPLINGLYPNREGASQRYEPNGVAASPQLELKICIPKKNCFISMVWMFDRVLAIYLQTESPHFDSHSHCFVLLHIVSSGRAVISQVLSS